MTLARKDVLLARRIVKTSSHMGILVPWFVSNESYLNKFDLAALYKTRLDPF